MAKATIILEDNKKKGKGSVILSVEFEPKLDLQKTKKQLHDISPAQSYAVDILTNAEKEVE